MMEQPDRQPASPPPPPLSAEVPPESAGNAAMTTAPPTTATAPRVDTHYQSTGVWPAVVGGLIIAALVVIFVAQNTHANRMHFLWFSFKLSPGVLVLATGLLAVAAAIGAGAVWRVRRRRVLAEREELERLRENATT